MLAITRPPVWTGRMMEDGEGRLQDGTQYKRESGETKGKNGYWYRWTKLSGISGAGKVGGSPHLPVRNLPGQCVAQS